MYKIKKLPSFDHWLKDLKDLKAKDKIDFGPGYRLYYMHSGGVIIILLCGGSKRTQDTDIKLAQHLAKLERE